MVNESTFRVVLGSELICITAIGLYYAVKAVVSGSEHAIPESELSIILRLLLRFVGMVVLLAYLLSPQSLAWSAVSLPVGLRWLGAGLGFAAMPLLWWVHHAQVESFSTTLLVSEDQTLVTPGPYRWVRHPMYTVFFIIVLSFFLLSANWLIGLVWMGGLVLVGAARVRKEERLMLVKFGDLYRQYRQRTGRFLPRLRTSQNPDAEPTPR